MCARRKPYVVVQDGFGKVVKVSTGWDLNICPRVCDVDELDGLGLCTKRNKGLDILGENDTLVVPNVFLR